MKISSVTIAILSSVLLGLPAAVSGQERFDMVSIFPIDGISVEDRCSPIELRKLRDHTQLALNAVMMMNHDQVGDLHYNEGMDVDEYFGGDASNRQLEQVPAGYQWAVFLCGCTYRRAIYDPDRPRCHGQEGGGVDLALFWNVLGIWVSLCITVAITGRMVVVVVRSISDKMPRHSKTDESSSELAADGPAVDLYEKTAKRVPEPSRRRDVKGVLRSHLRLVS